MRDFGKPCVCCGEPLGEGYHAGHLFESGNNTIIRFNEFNIHGQRAICNTAYNGDSGSYKPNAIKRVGLEKYNELKILSESKVVCRLTIEDYLNIIDYYKGKINDLQSAA